MQQQQQSYVAYGEPQPIGYIPGGAIQAPPRRLPDATCLRFFIMVLLFLGIVQLFSIQGILALTIVCKFGCGCSSSHQILRSLTGREGCCSLNCRGVATAFFSALTILAGSFGMQFLSNICGIVVTDTTNDVQKLAYNAGLAAIGVAEGVWQLRHPSLSAPVDTESSAGTFAWAFVYPSDVCDIMPKELKFSGTTASLAPIPPTHPGQAPPVDPGCHPCLLMVTVLPVLDAAACPCGSLRVWLAAGVFPFLCRQRHLLSAPVVLLRRSNPHLYHRRQHRHHPDSLRRVPGRLQAAHGLPEPIQRHNAASRLCRHAVKWDQQ